MTVPAQCVRCRTPLVGETSGSLCETCFAVSTFDTGLAPPSREISDETLSHVPREVDLSITASYGQKPASIGDLHTKDFTSKSTPVQVRFEDRFVLQDLLGVGGMGEVWSARDRRVERQVAIKFLRPELRQTAQFDRLAVEAKSLAGLNHSNVVTLFEFVPEADKPYICLEYVPGQSLAKRIKDGGPLETEEAVRIAEQMARGVHAANSIGVIHRDLKPSNAMLGTNGDVKVLDFGLAKRTGSTDDLTATGQMIGGTPGFMAPEQLDGNIAPEPRVDVWGLGATLYSLLTGQSPFPTGMANIAKVKTDELKSPRTLAPKIPKEIDALVCKCLDKDPIKRYASVGEVADDLARWQRGEPTKVRPENGLQKVGRAIRKVPRSTRIILAAIALLGAIALALAMIPKRTQEQRDQAELRAGRAVTLIGDTLPENRQFRMFLEPNRLGKSEVVGSGAALMANAKCLCQLMDAPEIENYRIDLEVQQREQLPSELNAAPGNSAMMAFYFGHSLIPTPTGIPSHVFFTVDTNDFDLEAAEAGLPPKDRRAVFRCLHIPDENGPKSSIASTQLKNGKPFKPSTVLPGPWRSISVEVKPAGVKIWWNDASRTFAPFVEYNREELNEAYADKVAVAFGGTHITPVGAPNWSPKMPFGLFALRANFGVKNATVTPIQP